MLAFIFSPMGKYLALFLVVSSLIFGGVKYIQKQERLKNQIEQLEDFKETTEGINDKVNESRESNPTRDGDIARQRLCERQNREC